MCAAINSLNQIPKDVLVHCFSSLTVGDLCRVGQVCRNCLQVSEENWRQTYLTRRNIVMWSGPPPSSWRRYVEKTKELFPLDPIKSADLLSTCCVSGEDTTIEVLNAWKQGFPNEAVVFAQRNAWSHPLSGAKAQGPFRRTKTACRPRPSHCAQAQGLPIRRAAFQP